MKDRRSSNEEILYQKWLNYRVNLRMCKEWRDSFHKFYEDVKNIPKSGERGTVIDRIDTNLEYTLGNVRFVFWRKTDK